MGYGARISSPAATRAKMARWKGRLGLRVLQHHDGITGLFCRDKARKPVIFQLCTAGKLTGLGRAGLACRGLAGQGGLMAGAPGHYTRQQGLQGGGGALCKHPPALDMGKRREGRAGGLVQSGLQQQRGAADPPQAMVFIMAATWRGMPTAPLPKAEIGVGPAGCKSLPLRQDPSRRVQGIGKRDRLSEAQLLCHGADSIGPQRLPQPDEVAVAALFQR